MKQKIQHIKRELADLDIQTGSEAYNFIYAEAVAAADILSKRELTQLIEDHLENFSFQQRGF